MFFKKKKNVSSVGRLVDQPMKDFKRELKAQHINVERYAEQDSYKENTKFEKESFTLIQDILEEAGELESLLDFS